MAEGVVSFLLENLGSPLFHEAALQYGPRDQVEWLRAELRWKSCFLKDAETKGRNGNEHAKNWVWEIWEVSHRAEDAIDTFVLQIEHRRNRGLMDRFRRYAAYPYELRSHHKLGSEIERLRTKIDQIAASRERYGLVDLGGSTTTPSADEILQARRRISPSLEESGDSVVGGGGDSHKKILEQLLDASISMLHSLKERRYFIISDDVWRRDVWEETGSVLPDVKNGSRVLITTRSIEVARSADPAIRPYQLPFLSNEESWDFFLKKAFPAIHDVDPRCPRELENFGRQPVKRCGGLSLALLVLGGLLSRKDHIPGCRGLHEDIGIELR